MTPFHKYPFLAKQSTFQPPAAVVPKMATSLTESERNGNKMVSDSEMDSELVCRLRKFLSTSDVNTTTTALVRRKLEEDLGTDLSGKTAFIRKQVNLYLQSQFERAEESEEGDHAHDKGEENEQAGDDGEAAANVKSEEEEDEEKDELEEAYNGKGTAKRGSKKRKKEVKKRGSGFCKLCSLSPELQKFVRVPKLARNEVVKQLWSYIREKNLHDPRNRQNIICDDILRALFNVDCINMFQMNKALAKHIWSLDSDNGCRDPTSVPNASIDVSIPAAIPTFTPTIVATMPETSRVNVGSEVPMILRSKEELFDGVASSFLPFLHRLYHYHGNIFSEMMTQPCFLRIMNLQILGSLMQSLDKKPLESLTLEEIDGLCNGLNAVKSCQIDICWLETGLQDARHLVEASHVKAELTKLQQDIDTTDKLLSEMKNKRARLTGRAETLVKLSTVIWASDSSIFENLLK